MEKVVIEEIVQARIVDAEELLHAQRFDGSVYLCGYAVELGLKARICRTLQWDSYPMGHEYKSFKTHNLDVLLRLTGLEDKVRLKHMADWSIVAQWNPEARYKTVGSISETDAQDMLASTKELLRQL